MHPQLDGHIQLFHVYELQSMTVAMQLYVLEISYPNKSRGLAHFIRRVSTSNPFDFWT